jgi:hypothetical protein
MSQMCYSVKKLSKSCQKVVKKMSKKLWGNSSSKAFGISFADRPKAIKREFLTLLNSDLRPTMPLTQGYRKEPTFLH